MTDDQTRCGQCGGPMPGSPARPGVPGRRRRYCSDACRQGAHRARSGPRCETRIGTVRCPRTATGRLLGATLPGALLTAAYQADVCGECRPTAVEWLTRSAGVQPVWTSFDGDNGQIMTSTRTAR